MIIFVNIINWLDFLVDVQCVYIDVGPEFFGIV
jgi:hypothetical protein